MDEDCIFNYFFTDNKVSSKLLCLDNKIGREEGYRFNPEIMAMTKCILKETDTLLGEPFNEPTVNQYYFVRNYAKNNKDISKLVELCLFTMYKR